MMSFFNPFNEIFETPNAPHARTLRTSFSRKMWDTFYVFAGSFFDHERKNHLGIFDYATLMIPQAITQLTFFLVKSDHPIVIAPLIPLAIISGLLALVRYALAGVATLIASPFVAIAHAISSHRGNRLKKEVTEINIVESPNAKEESKRIRNSLGPYLQTSPLFEGSLESLAASIKKESTNNNLTVEFRYTSAGNASASVVCDCCMNGGAGHVPFSATFNLENSAERNQFESLRKLNVGEISDQYSFWSKRSLRALPSDDLRDESSLNVR